MGVKKIRTVYMVSFAVARREKHQQQKEYPFQKTHVHCLQYKWKSLANYD
jgi:hypothetical protein